jgi:hypothetical protein
LVVKKNRPGRRVGRLAELVTEKNWRAWEILPIIQRRMGVATRQAIVSGFKVRYTGIRVAPNYISYSALQNSALKLSRSRLGLAFRRDWEYV